MFAKVFKQAIQTFSSVNKDSLEQNLQKLRRLADKLQLSDLNISPFVVSKEAFCRQNKAPTTFVNIFENSRFQMSIFILNTNYKMPLHDHPGMTGILKVISGKVKLQSYSRIQHDDDSGKILVNREIPRILDKNSPASFLTGCDSNYHEITALDGGPAAFFDVLSPPYSDIEDASPDSRHCSFYQKIVVDEKTLQLEKIECPAHYFCDTLHFEKPDFMRQEST